jgi:hypothetical protein
VVRGQSILEIVTATSEIDTGAAPISAFGVTEMSGFGWNFLWA